jgi:hypothetical protein
LCSRLDEDPARCLGEIRECDAAFANCGPVQGFVPSAQECLRDYVKARWDTLELVVLNLREPSRPAVSRLRMPRDEQALGAWSDGSDLYYTFKQPVAVADDPRSYAAYAYKRIDLRDPAEPAISPPVSVPGQLLAVRDGALYLRDFGWQGDLPNRHVISVRRAQLGEADEDGRASAELEATHELGEDDFESLALADADTLAYVLRGDALVLSNARTLEPRSRVPLRAEQALQALQGRRALLGDGHSLTVVDFDDPEQARVASHHLVRGWANSNVWLEDELIVAAGPYGLQRFSTTTDPLSAPVVPR